MKLKMARLQIVGLKHELLAVLHTLHRLGCVQLDDLATDPPPGIRPITLTPAHIQQREQLAFLLTRLDSVLHALEQRNNAAPPISANNLAETAAGFDAVAGRVQALVNQRDALLAEQQALPRYETTLRQLAPLVPAAARDPANLTHVVLVSRAHRWLLDQIAADIRAATEQAILVEENIGQDMRAMLIVAPRQTADALARAVGREEIARLQLPPSLAGQPPDTAMANLRQRLNAIPGQITAVDQALGEISAESGPSLRLWRLVLQDELDRLNAVANLGETNYTFILRGWLPERDVSAVIDSLQAQHGPLVHCQLLALTRDDLQQVPVALNNPAPVRPFERLVRLLAHPRYTGLDPSGLLALFMPLFFGMILGDIGYGLIILLSCILLLRRYRAPGAAHDILQVILFGSVWGIIFGILYGEAFGTLGAQWGLHAVWLERASAEQVPALLLFSLAVGAAHITLGLILGVWEAWRARHRKHGLERGGMLLGLMGLFLLVAVLADLLPQVVMTPAIAVMTLGIVMLSAAGGWLGILLGPIEFIGLLGNILSYLRIAAVGLASVYVALIANRLAGSLGSVIVGVIVAVLIHALNIALGAFSPTIHSLRLHYVEFFRKFYEGGAEPFRPFRAQADQRVYPNTATELEMETIAAQAHPSGSSAANFVGV